ncbi:MAG TPA: S8/S53 family peptidase [Candidatus Poseidoniaceae archaeon]|nr:S8/S53 family peptidase [Candidatus Poseidoniaceae archaeon]
MADEADSEVILASLDSASLMEPRALIAVGILTFLLIFSFFALALTGNSSPQSPGQETIENDGWRAFSVVAPVDTGINVYHDHFRTNETYPSWLLDELGVNKICELTFDGTWQERYDTDKESCWDSLTASDIVYFPGTKIIGTSPDGDSDILILDDPSDGHGSAVTGAVLNANSQAVIFFVEGFSTEAVLAAANQPLVDVITTSFGAPGSVPVSGIERGTEIAVVEQGKMHTGAADNSPSPAIQDSTAGPPWSIGIAGYAEEGDDQKEIMSGSYPDISADWTQYLPNHDDIDGYHETSGTSFATPRTAGILSFVLESLRFEFNDYGAGASPDLRQGMLVNGTDSDGNSFIISNADVREALNRSAWYPEMGWDPTSGTMPISPVAPCTQTGWGLVNLSNIEPMIAHLNQTSELGQRPSDVVVCMDANQEMREAYWNAYPSTPDVFGERYLVNTEGVERRLN